MPSQQNQQLGETHAVHRLHLEGETRPVLVRFVPDLRSHFLMFLKREDDGARSDQNRLAPRV